MVSFFSALRMVYVSCSKINLKGENKMQKTIFTKIWLDLLLLKNSVELFVLSMVRKAEKTFMSAKKKKSDSEEAEDTDITFADISGNDAAKQTVENLVSGMKDRRSDKPAGDDMPSAVLLFGPHGVGKSMLLDAAANTATVPVIGINGAKFSKYDDFGADLLKFQFNLAKGTKDPCIIFIDDIDAFSAQIADKSNNSKVQQRTYKALIDGLSEISASPNVLVIAAASCLSDLTPEVRDLFDERLPMNPYRSI